MWDELEMVNKEFAEREREGDGEGERERRDRGERQRDRESGFGERKAETCDDCVRTRKDRSTLLCTHTSQKEYVRKRFIKITVLNIRSSNATQSNLIRHRNMNAHVIEP